MALLLVFLACGDAPESPVGSTESAVMNSLAWTSEVGRIGGAHSVGDDGQFRYSMALELPSGRAGFTPDIRLSYASDSSVGVVGVGFQLDAGSAITRCGRTVAIDGFVAGPRYDDSDVFCLDGARLVPEAPGSNVYRTANESHLRATAHYDSASEDGPERWSVEYPDGTIGRFGAGASGDANLRPTISGESGVAYWLEGEREDQFGNLVGLTWDPPHYPTGETAPLPRSLLRTIQYGAHVGGDSHRYEVRFEYSTAYPTQSGYQAGHAWQLRGVLEGIRVHQVGDPAPFSTYLLKYSTEGSTGNARLVSLQHCVKAPGTHDPSDPPGNVCKRPTEFEWSHGASTGPTFQEHQRNWEMMIDRDLIPRAFQGAFVVEDFSTVLPLDFNGDRIDDLLYVHDDRIFVRLGHADSAQSLGQVVATSIMGPTEVYGLSRQYMVRDHDGDGRDDLLLVRAEDSDDDGYYDEARLVWLQSTGTDFTTHELGVLGPLPNEVDWDGPGDRSHLLRYTLPGYLRAYGARGPGNDPTGYYDASLSFANDFDGDGATDVISCQVALETDCGKIPITGPNQPSLPGCLGEWTVMKSNADTFPSALDPPQTTDIRTVCRAQRSPGWGAAMGDFTGDGVADLLYVGSDVLTTPQAESDQFSVSTYRILSFDPQAEAFVSLDTEVDPTRLLQPSVADVNGDGISDLIGYRRPEGASDPDVLWADMVLGMPEVPIVPVVHLGKGDGTFGPREAIVPESWGLANSQRRHQYAYCDGLCANDTRYQWLFAPPQAMDADGDGRTDLVLDSLPWNDTHTSQDSDSLVYSWPSAAPTLATWPGRGSNPFPVEGVRRTSQYVNFEDSGVAPSSGRLTIFDQNTRAGDFNGDGQEDLLRYDLPSDDYPLAPPTTGSLRLFTNVRSEHERVVLVRDGLGQEVSVAYEPPSNPHVYRPTDACYYPQRCSRSTNPLVASVSVGLGDNKHDTEYEYWDGRVDVLGRGDLGFARTIVRDVPTGAVRIRLFDTVTVEGNHVYPHAGTPVIEVNVDTDKSSSTTPPSLRTVGNIRRFENVVHTHETALGQRRDSIVRTVEEVDVFEDLFARSEEELESPNVFDGLVPVSGSVTTMEYDGDPTDPSLWDFPTETSTWTSDALPTVITSDYRPADRDDRWIAGRLERQYRTSGKSAPCVRQSSASWVYHSETGALRAEERQSSHPLLTISETERKTQFVRTEVDYDDFGNVTDQRVDTLMTPRRTTTWNFGADGWRVHSLTNDLGHETKYEHHSRFGTLVAQIDPNGNRDEVLLDGFGRVAEHRSASGMDRERSYAWAPGTLPGMEVTDTYSDGSFRVARLDEFGRLVRERRPGLQGGSPRDVLRRVDYDRVGRVRAVWEPIWDGESWTTENRAHRFDYNSVGMLRRETMPDGMVHEYTRGVRSATFTDPNDHRYEMHFDARGNVVRSIEPGGAEQQFSWCLDGRLASTTGPTGVTDSNGYDALGRLVVAQDSTRGTSTYGLDPFGNHLKVTSPVATIGAQYDSLNRLVQRTDVDGTATFTYDTGQDAIGRLVETHSADGIRTMYAYDGVHLAKRGVAYADGTDLWFGYIHDSIGRLTTVHYPRGAFKVGYAYEGNGLLTGVTDASTGDSLWNATSFTPRGLVALELLGDGSTTGWKYRPGSSRVTDITAKDSSGDLILDLGYGHDFSGAVTRLEDRLHSFVETFEYDDRGRMTDTSSPEGALEYTYDELGNMTFASKVGTIKFDDPNRPYVPTYINSVKQYYDDAGRFIGDDNGRAVSWTPFGAIRQLKDPASLDVEYRYDALGQRRLEFTAGGHRYRFDDYEMDQYGNESIVIRAAGRVIATGAREPGQPMKLVFAHTDDLGSPRVMTDGAGNVVEERVRAPFGDTYDASWSTPLPDTSVPGLRGLTGHREAGKLGIVEMGARDYDVGTKRMLSPDPIIARPLGIQGRHPYSYVWNQPRNFVDPLGMTPERPTESGANLDPPPVVENGGNLDRPPGSRHPRLGVGTSQRPGPTAREGAGGNGAAPKPQANPRGPSEGMPPGLFVHSSVIEMWERANRGSRFVETLGAELGYMFGISVTQQRVADGVVLQGAVALPMGSDGGGSDFGSFSVEQARGMWLAALDGSAGISIGERLDVGSNPALLVSPWVANAFTGELSMNLDPRRDPEVNMVGRLFRPNQTTPGVWGRLTMGLGMQLTHELFHAVAGIAGEDQVVDRVNGVRRGLRGMPIRIGYSNRFEDAQGVLFWQQR